MPPFASIHRLLFVWVNSFAPFIWIALLVMFFDAETAQENGVSGQKSGDS